MKKDGRSWVDLHRETQAKLEKALAALDTIAQGRYYAGDGDSLNSTATNLQATAAGTLRRIATMTQRPEPSRYYF